MFEKTYTSMTDQITAHPELIDRTEEMIKGQPDKLQSIRFPRILRPIGIGAALILCILLTTPVLAANVSSIYELMYLVSPNAAQYFVPIQAADEDKGIRMEVVSTYIHEDTAEIYLTLQDLTGDRVDETTDLFDSYTLRRAFDSAANASMVGYDADTKTATFLITIREWGNQRIEGKKITFSLKEFISKKKKFENVPIEIDLAKIGKAESFQKIMNIVGWSGIESNSQDEATVLTPGMGTALPAQGMEITAIGYLDNKLHIQLAARDKLIYDNHGYFYLEDQKGNKISGDYSVSFVEGEGEKRIDYQEFIFDIPQNEIDRYTLYGSFYTSGLNTQGNWQVTFPLITTD